MKRLRNVTNILLVLLMVFGLFATNLGVLATDVGTDCNTFQGIKLIKIDSSTGKRIQGAKFVFSQNENVVKNFNGANPVGKFDILITNEKGEINQSLTQGLWYYKEIEATGYVITGTVYNVNIISKETTEVIFKNTSLGKLRIIKENPEKTRLDGAEFKVAYLREGKEEVIREKVAAVNGEVVLNNLEPGTYRIYETKAPDGYNLVAGYKEIEVEPFTKREYIAEVTFTNTPVGYLKINKYKINTTTKLEGAVFQIFKDSELKVPVDGSPFTTDKNGEILISLAPGTYFIREIKAPSGYILNEDVYRVTINMGSTTKLDVNNTPYPPTAGNYASTLLAGLLLALGTTILYIGYRFTKKRIAR